MESAGARLKKIRLEKGLTLEEVHKKTKIHLEVLRAIEEESFVDLNPVYIRSFLKMYCQALGVDPAQFIEGYKEPLRTAATADIQPDHAFLAPVASPSRFIKTRAIKIALVASAALVAVIVLVHLTRFVAVRISQRRKPAAAAVLKKASRPKPAKQQPRPAAAVPVAVEPGYAFKVSQSSEAALRIGIQALDDCWIQARVDGKTIFQNVLRRGRSENWIAKEKVELLVGSAGSVQLEINGKIIPALGRRGQTLKNIVITKEGLRVGK